MNMSKMMHLSAMMLIGDGVTALLRPHQDVNAWQQGPAAWRGLMHYLDERPGLTRTIGAVEIVVGLLWLVRKKAPVRELMENAAASRAA